MNAKKSNRRYLFYIAGDSIDIRKLAYEGFLPLTKRQRQYIKSRGYLPSEGDLIIVTQRRLKKYKGVVKPNYRLICLCETQNLEGRDHKIQGLKDFKYVIKVRTLSIGEVRQDRRLKFLDFGDIDKLPTVLIADQKIYNKVVSKFPLLTLQKEIAHIASNNKDRKEPIKGYVFDFERMELCRLVDFLSQLDDDSLESTLRKRIASRHGHEMVERLHQEALRVIGADLERMDPYKFEKLCGELVHSYGMEVHNTQKSRDGGVDIIARDNTPFRKGDYLFQVKRREKVGEEVVKLLDASLKGSKAVKGIIMTTGSFTEGAIREAESRNIELIDGILLRRLFDKIQALPQTSSASTKELQG